MKSFGLRLLSFFAFLSAFFTILASALYQTESCLLKMPEGKHILFLGNSHTEAAIDDSIIKSAFNFGRSAERIEFLYPKLKMMKRVNPQIDTVYIGLDYILMCHSVKEEFNSVLMHPYNFWEYDLKDWYCIFSEGNGDYLTSFFAHPLSWMKLLDLRHLLSGDSDVRDCKFLGGFNKEFHRDKLADDPRNMHKVAVDAEFDRIPFNYYFANRCIEYCRNNGIKLVFFCTPHHRFCPFAGYQQQLVDDFSNVEFHNHVRMELPDSCYADLDHLNPFGAAYYSEYLEYQVIHSRQ